MLCLSALPLVMSAAAAARAQDLTRPEPPVAPVTDTPPPADDQQVTFSADTLTYDDKADVVTASGSVHMLRQGNELHADTVSWDRKTGEVRAIGNVAIRSPNGDIAYGDNVELKDTLKDGAADNMLLVLENGGRIAAVHGTRVDGVSTLDHAAYTPCAVVSAEGCPKTPLWQITAVRVVHNPAKHRVFYKNATLSLLGVPILALPGISHPDGSGGGGPGLLVPDIQYNKTNGLELALPYYIKLAPNKDLTITPHLFTGVLPALEAKYRSLLSYGAYQIGGMITYGTRLPATTITDPDAPAPTGSRAVRGYIDANGTFQLGSDWTLTGALRLTTDRTFLRRYSISNDDRLRSMLMAERITADSYLSIAGWYVQTLRAGDPQGQQPFALPAIDYRLRLPDKILGGQVQVQANSLGIIRTAGQDTQRAFASVEWNLRTITPLGQELTLTGFGRGDVYHTSNTAATSADIYRGLPGWQTRGIAAFAADVRWPFAGELFGGTQVLVPRVQIVASPPTKNLEIPNEDSRAFDLEDSNLFALNRFPGYDRWEDGNRVTYGFEWNYVRPRFSISTVIGQSYRLTNKPSLFPVGTGLTDRFSDIVGRTEIRYGSFLGLIHRFRLDKDSLALRRNEIDVTLGSKQTYLLVNYLRLNRNIVAGIEDLRDHEEIRLGARVAIDRHWSVFGSTVVDLTSRSEDPLSMADGYQPVRNRLGVEYEDDCFEFGLTWKRDYDRTGDARAGSTVLFRLAFKNLGR